jgi:NAD(P)-dependent dehydrogenase (short-subunit alcohol dehydrogenase family)
MQKPICLITGATEGIGRVTATELARKGFTVVLAARNAAKAEAVKKEIAASTGSRDADCIVADLRSLAQVRQLSETFRQRYPRLDVLINNAGIFMPARQVTEDGYETTYQVNYLSQFYLTRLLLDELRKSSQGRIVNLSSSVYAAGRFEVRNLRSENRFSTFRAYSDSKLLMLLFTVELADRLKGTRVTANAVHPGVVRTQMMLRAPGFFRVAAYLALPFALSPQKGAATSIYLACSPEVKDVSGKYFTRCRATDFKTAFNTPSNRDLLWNLSMKSLPLEEVPRR